MAFCEWLIKISAAQIVLRKKWNELKIFTIRLGRVKRKICEIPSLITLCMPSIDINWSWWFFANKILIFTITHFLLIFFLYFFFLFFIKHTKTRIDCHLILSYLINSRTSISLLNGNQSSFFFLKYGLTQYILTVKQ